MTRFRFDPISQSSEVSLLKDVVGHEHQVRFVKQNLSEVEIGFYTRNKGNTMIPTIMDESAS